MWDDHHKFMKKAVEEANRGLKVGGIPIGAILVKEGRIIGKGRNKLLEKQSSILHAEMDCIENVLFTRRYRRVTCVRV
jgi:cytosine/creatinine deaminase